MSFKKRNKRQPESSSFSVGVASVIGGVKILVRPNQKLQQNISLIQGGTILYSANGQQGLMADNEFRDFYATDELFQNVVLYGDTDISRFYPSHEQGDDYSHGFGVFNINEGVNYLILCVPCRAFLLTDGINIDYITIGSPWAGESLEGSLVDFQNCMRLEIMSSVPPTTTPAPEPESTEYVWQYYIPLARINLNGVSISVEKFDIGNAIFSFVGAEIPVATVGQQLPLELLSSYFGL